MKTKRALGAVIAALMTTGALGACADEARQVEQGAENAVEKAEQGAKKAGEEIKEGAKKVEKEADEAAGGKDDGGGG